MRCCRGSIEKDSRCRRNCKRNCHKKHKKAQKRRREKKHVDCSFSLFCLPNPVNSFFVPFCVFCGQRRIATKNTKRHKKVKGRSSTSIASSPFFVYRIRLILFLCLFVFF